MARPDFDVFEDYLGNGTLDEYSFSFKIEALAQLLIEVYSDTNVLIESVRGDDTTYLDSVTFDPVKGTGVVKLKANLPNDYQLFIYLANDEPTQPFEFKNKGSFTLERIERAFDYLAGPIQRLAYLMKRTVRISELDDPDSFNLSLPPGINDPENRGRVLLVDASGTGFGYGPTGAEISGAEAAAESAQEAKEAAEAAVAAAEDAQNAAEAAAQSAEDAAEAAEAIVALSFAGYSQTLSKLVDVPDMPSAITELFNFQYLGPQVNLSASGSGTVREKGTAVTSVNLVATVTRRTDPIASIVFKKDGSVIHTVSSPSPGNSMESYTWTGSFDDNSTFTVEVADDGASGGPTTVTGTQNFTFVYPYYVGAGNPSLSASSVAGLTKRVITSTASRVESITAVDGNVFYFAYPASYGALASILDANGFETFPDWTLRTENITGLNGNAISYRIYEFNNPVVAGSYTYTFRR